MSEVILEQRSPLGAGLLPENLAEGREESLQLVHAAYYSVLGKGAGDWMLWQRMRQAVVATLRRRYEEAGLCAPPFQWESFWRRIDKRLPATDSEGHVGLIEALMTDCSELFTRHVDYRLSTDGNVHLEITGPPGLAKSSCGMAVMDFFNPLDPENLERHLSIDVADLPGKLVTKQRGEWVQQDEFVKTAGEGSGTIRNLFENLEDTLRKSGVSLIALSPRRHDHASMQAVLEVFAWCPERKFSVFLVWLDGVPHGVMAIPWARLELWLGYEPWKAGNVERTLRGQFHDTGFLARMALKVMADERFVQFMTSAPNKPKLKDFETGITFFQAQMMAGSQAKMLADFMHVVCYGWPRIEKHFEQWFGLQANDGLKRVALLCYDE